MAFQFAFILPTTDCAVHCEHCFYECGHTDRVESVDYLAPLDAALDHLVSEGLQQVIISGGEPLLSPRLAPMLELCQNKIVHLLLLTHGDLLDAKMIERLEELGLDDLTISAARADEQLRETVQRVIFRSRFFPTLLTTITRNNLDEVPGLLAFSCQLNVPHLFTPAYIPAEVREFDRLTLWNLDHTRWEQLMDDLGQWAMESNSVKYWELVRGFYHEIPKKPGFCPMGTHGLVVDADGTVYPCFHRHDLPAGNLTEQPWPEIHRRLVELGKDLYTAPCFGEHCLSMFAGMR